MSADGRSASAAVASPDPTGTATLRERVVAQFNARWREFRGTLRETVRENDALRLSSQRDHGPAFSPRRRYSGRAVDDFGAETNADRRAAWGAWLPAALALAFGMNLGHAAVAAGEHFTARPIREAYARGVALAGADARKAGLLDAGEFPTPSDLIGQTRHQDALRERFIEMFEDVQAVVDKTQADMTRTLRDGIQGGSWAPALAASALAARVGAVGQTGTMRATLANIVTTVNVALLMTGSRLGARRVGFDVEDGGTDVEGTWTTAGDSRVCQECRALDGETYPIEDVRNGTAPMPVRDTHIGCRCRIRLVG